MRAFLAQVPRGPIATVRFLVELNALVHRAVRYVSRAADGTHTPEETLEAGEGSCRDSAWLLVQALRHLGLPARFVSGYLIQLAPDVAPLEGPASPARDMARLARLGRGVHSGRRLDRARSDIGAPRRGRAHPARRNAALSLGGTDLRHRGAGRDEVFVRDGRRARRRDAPRHAPVFRRGNGTRSMRSASRSTAISNARMFASRRAASRPSCRSTTIRRPSGPLAALGPRQARARRRIDAPPARAFRAAGADALRARQVVPRRSRRRAGPSTLYWRRDGKPLWRDAALIAHEADKATLSPEDAKRFAEAVAAALGVKTERVQAAYEDPAHWMLQEDALPPMSM